MVCSYEYYAGKSELEEQEEKVPILLGFGI